MRYLHAANVCVCDNLLGKGAVFGSVWFTFVPIGKVKTGTLTDVPKEVKILK